MRRQCAAKRKDGQPCGGAPLRGADKCRMHLGKKTAIVKLEQAARAELARLDLPPVEDPLSRLAEVCAQVLGWKDQIAGKVNALDGLRYENEQGGEQLRAEVALWERALDRCERFLTAMARLDIDSRLAKISETQAEAIVGLVGAICSRLRLDDPQRRAALAVVEEYFAA